MPPVKPIILNARTPQGECIGAVRLTPEKNVELELVNGGIITDAKEESA